MTQQKVTTENYLTISDEELSEDARLMRQYFMQLNSDTTNNKISQKAKIFQDLDKIAPLIPSPLYWTGLNGIPLGANKQLLDAIGASREDLIGKTPYNFYPKEAADSVLQHVKKIVNTGTISSQEDKVIDIATGRTKYFTAIRAPLKDESGKIIGIVGTSIDITERKKYEQELLTYAEIMNNLPGAIYWKDKQSRYLKINDFALKLAAFPSPEQMVGKKDAELWPKFAEMLVQNDQKVMRSEKPMQFEEAITMLNGKTRYFAAVKIPLKDKDGSIAGIIGNSIDITELKEQEEKLIIYKQVVENLPGYIYWKDKNSTYIGANKNLVEISGLKNIQEVLGKTDASFSWGKHANEFIQGDQIVMQTGKTLITEDCLSAEKYKDAAMIVRTEKKPLLNKDGEIIGVLGVAVDITERKKLEEKQNEFAKIVLQVVHDIRSPLTVIDMLTSEINQLPEEQRVSLKHAVRRIHDIANHLIDTYKGRNASDNSIAQKIPIAVFIDRTVSEKRFQFVKKGVEFQVDIASDAYFAFTFFEASELQRVLSNLINNAVEASVKNACIEINVKIAANHKLILNIKDHGIGMTEELIKKVGEYGLSHGKEKGAGLGLAHAKEWMEKNNGQLQIASKLNEGTVVTLYFNLIESPSWFAQKINLTKDSKILIIDDDPSIHFLWRQRFAMFKEIADLKILHFHYAKDLEDWFNNNEVDAKHLVLLSDNELIGSELNGQQLLEKYAGRVNQAFLVTSHYTFYDLAENLSKIKAQILPKELVMHVPINIEKPQVDGDKVAKKIEFVLLDDNEILTQAYQFLAKSKNRNILTFNQPAQLLAVLEQMPKDTAFYIDSQLGEIQGEDFAKELFDRGYKELYLATGSFDIGFDIASYPWLKGVCGKPEL